MLKKIFTVLAAVFVLNSTCAMPASADDEYAHIKTSLVSDLNVNKSSKHEIVQFLSINDYRNGSNLVIPQKTLFTGRIEKMKKSRFAFRRAKAQIKIYEMVLPDGRKFTVQGETERHTLKGSAAGNVLKGILLTPPALVTGAAGLVLIAAETVTIIGLIAVPPTAAAAGGLIGKMTKGVNCKIEEGDIIKIKIKPSSKREVMVSVPENAV